MIAYGIITITKGVLCKIMLANTLFLGLCWIYLFSISYWTKYRHRLIWDINANLLVHFWKRFLTMIKIIGQISHSAPAWTLVLIPCLQLPLCDDEGRAKMTLWMHTYNFKVQLWEWCGVCYLILPGLFYVSVSLLMEHELAQM